MGHSKVNSSFDFIFQQPIIMNGITENEWKQNALMRPIEFSENAIRDNELQIEHNLTYVEIGIIAALLLYSKEHYECKALLFIGLVIFVLSIVYNVLLYPIVNRMLRKDMLFFEDLRNNLKLFSEKGITNRFYYDNMKLFLMDCDSFQKEINAMIDKRGKKIRLLNLLNLALFIIGICVSFIFILLNI